MEGCSLKSVIAADSLLSWAENGNLAMQTTDVIEDAYTEWYDSLSTDEQDSFADAWPLIKEDANALLTDTSSMAGGGSRIRRVCCSGRSYRSSEFRPYSSVFPYAKIALFPVRGAGVGAKQ